jgi:hypothetical protein
MGLNGVSCLDRSSEDTEYCVDEVCFNLFPTDRTTATELFNFLKFVIVLDVVTHLTL